MQKAKGSPPTEQGLQPAAQPSTALAQDLQPEGLHWPTEQRLGPDAQASPGAAQDLQPEGRQMTAEPRLRSSAICTA